MNPNPKRHAAVPTTAAAALEAHRDISPGAPSPVAQSGATRPGFSALAGLFFFVVIVKFGDPAILPTDSFQPQSLGEAIISSWPGWWAYWALAIFLLASAPLIPWRDAKLRHPILLALPAAWLLWQLVAATHTVDPPRTGLTLAHFAACTALFYLGYVGLNQCRQPWGLWVGMALALCWTLHIGWEQRFGGLAATKQYIEKIYGGNIPSALAARIADNRIFGTFVYPNTFAGGIILLLPITLVLIWKLTPKLMPIVRVGIVILMAGIGIAALIWSGSKAGWLLAIAVGILALIHCGLPRRWRIMAVSFIIVAGLAGFALRYAGYFKNGATSVSARFDYWKAGEQMISQNPILGVGPGGFGKVYQQIKDPKSEMAWLCHNDYLQQGTDSGIVGLALFCGFIFWSVYMLYRYRIRKNLPNEPLIGAFSLGLTGLCLHSFVEYHLYIPALSWPLFFSLGWLLSLE